MIIGIPKESKEQEYRVAMTPDGVSDLANDGHKVLVQKGAGLGSGFSDSVYLHAGAQMVPSYQKVIGKSDLVLKVKEPSPGELKAFRPGQILFTFLHLAANPGLARLLCRKKISSVAYETVQLPDGSLPLLKPMSAIAGRLAAQVGAHYLRHDQGGMGKLMGGVAGVERARVTVLGAGTVGTQATEVALGMGGEVVLMDVSEEKLERARRRFRERLMILQSNPENIQNIVQKTDLLIGAVLIPGARAPKLVSREAVKKMQKGSVIIDVAVDQGGCIATSRPTTHSHPIYQLYGVIHYGVTNMPGCVPRTATEALTHVTLPYIRALASRGIPQAFQQYPELKGGLNVWEGEIVNPRILEAISVR